MDVFPTRYRLNSKRVLRRFFPPDDWDHFSYYWNAEPTYHFGNLAVARAMQFVLAVKPGGEKLFIFLRKKAG